MEITEQTYVGSKMLDGHVYQTRYWASLGAREWTYRDTIKALLSFPGFHEDPNQYGPTAAEIAEKTDVTTAVAKRRLEKLAQAGIIDCAEKVQSRRGRPEKFFFRNPDKRWDRLWMYFTEECGHEQQELTLDFKCDLETAYKILARHCFSLKQWYHFGRYEQDIRLNHILEPHGWDAWGLKEAIRADKDFIWRWIGSNFIEKGREPQTDEEWRKWRNFENHVKWNNYYIENPESVDPFA